MRTVTANPSITFDADLRHKCTFTFEMQPIVRANDFDVFGYELLYRGLIPLRWEDVDRSLLRHLRESHYSTRLFVNLSNEGLLSTSDEDFIAAAQCNNIVFELSELFIDADTHKRIAKKVNFLTSKGLKFALDDFGSGHDGLHRLYSLENVSVIKIDGSLIRSALSRPSAAQTLRTLVSQWRANGISCVAECVESVDLLQVANSIGVDLCQGWYIDALIQNPEQYSISAQVLPFPNAKVG